MGLLQGSLYILAFAIFTTFFSRLLLQLDINKRTYNHVPGECGIIPNLPGAMDFETNINGKLFMAVNSMLNTTLTGHLFNFYSDNKTARELVIQKYNRPLKPTILSFAPGKNNDYLFVANSAVSTIEVLKVAENNEIVKLVRSYKNLELNKIQGIAAVDQKSFYYLTNGYRQWGLSQFFERFLPIPTSQIVFFNGVRLSNRYWVSSATAILFDDFKKILYVASFTKNSILSFKVNDKFDLVLHKETLINCSPTSLWKDIDGSLLITCHQVRFRYLLTFSNENSPTPSMVLRVLIPTQKDKKPSINQLYSNDGATISRANKAVRAGRNLLISDGKIILNCEL